MTPYELLEKEGIAKGMLSDTGKRALELYDKAVSIQKKHPEDETIKAQSLKMGQMANNQLKLEMEGIKASLKDEAEEASKAELRKAQSKKIIEKSEKIMDDLDACRQRLREDRKRKVESGEIKPPRKKTLTTRLREELLKLVNLIPKNLKEDKEVLQKTEKAILKFLSELKTIWGMNKIKPIQDEVKAKFDKLEEQAEAVH